MSGEYLVEGRIGWAARNPTIERSRLRWLALLILAALAFWLTGCASHPAYKTVKVATPVSCVPRNAAEAPKGLEAPDALAALPDGPTRYTRLSAAYLGLWAWSLTAIPVIEGCRAAGAPP